MTITLNFDFRPMIEDYLNSNPVSLFQWQEKFGIPVDFETPLENEVLLFSFVDENSHLMNITITGDWDMRTFVNVTYYN